MACHSGTGLYRQVCEALQDKEMLFVGEYVHGNAAIERLVARLAVELARASDFRILARESLYCLHPAWEQASLEARPGRGIEEQIIAYNASVPRRERILVTTVDLAHSIKHSPRLVSAFLEPLCGRSADPAAREQLLGYCRTLAGATTGEAKLAFIQGLRELSGTCWTGFDPGDAAELGFYLDLLEVSLQDTRGQDEAANMKAADTRNRWFIQTIERALDRTRQHGGRMVCHTGAPHAYKTYTGVEDYYVGAMPEARHFNQQVFPGKVYSLLVRPFGLDYYGQKCAGCADALEEHALANLGDEAAVLVDVREFRRLRPGADLGKYCRGDECQFDAIIYLKD